MQRDKDAVILEVLDLLSEGDHPPGKTVLQKTMYFLHALGGLDLGLRFVMYHYGPYSFDLTRRLESLAARGVIRMEPGANGFGYSMKLAECADPPQSVLTTRQQEGVKQFGRETVRDLELLATLHFVESILAERGFQVSDPEIIDQVRMLKPKFSPEAVRSAIQRLRVLAETMSA